MSLEVGGISGAIQFFLVVLIAFYLAGGGVHHDTRGTHIEQYYNEYPDFPRRRR